MFKEEVFEITDFTTSSNWERFITSLEEIICQWDLANQPTEAPLRRGAFVAGRWSEKYEVIKFGRVALGLTLHYLEDVGKTARKHEDTSPDDQMTVSLSTAHQDLMSKDNDFPGRAHHLVRCYGLREFLILSPAETSEPITTEDRAKLLLSSASIALSNTNCSTPFFVQMFQRQRRYYCGLCHGEGLRTTFDMIHFKEIPGPYRYLSELLNLLKEKIASPLNDCPPISIAIRFTHSLKIWPLEWQLKLTKEDDNHQEDTEETENLPKIFSQNKLEWGCQEEPLNELQLAASWPSVSEEVVVDSPVHSDLDPLQAPEWHLRVLFKDNNTYFISDLIFKLLFLKKSRHSQEQVLGRLITDSQAKDAEVEYKQALSTLTGHSYSSLANSMPQFFIPTWNRADWIRENCNHIFNQDDDSKQSSEFQLDFKSLKSAPYDSLTWRIVIMMCNIYSCYHELADVTFLWREIINQLRSHWENGTSIPRIGSGSPDMSCCLLHQKLQMINCCIEQKLKCEKRILELNSNTKAGEDSDDEFYDCDEDQQTDKIQPEGRLTRLGDMKLLNADEYLYVPITQEPPPMTEDLLQEQARVLSQLGTSAESANLKARMQCASLLSDMEAFKAANPGAIIEDFIRWHSPRDWIANEDPKDETKGWLSTRMQAPGNMWLEVWQSAEAVPVHRQKKLFDYTKEAEKVFHYLNSLTINDLVELLMPVVIQSALMQIEEERNKIAFNNEDVAISKDLIISNCNSFSFESCLSLIKESEMKIIHLASILKKFLIANDLEIAESNSKNEDEIRRLLLKVTNEPEVKIVKAGFGYFGKLLKRMFIESQIAAYEASTSVGERAQDDHDVLINKLPAPIAKEFIFRVNVARPKSSSRTVPQRLYCLLSPGEFRLAGAFSEDTSFY